MTRTRTAIGESLRRAHSALLKDLHKLEDAVGASSKESAADLSTRLRATRADIGAHFRFEEENGYMDAVRKQAPQFERTVQHLAEEHAELAETLDAVSAEVAKADVVSESTRGKIRHWIDQVRQHEARENDLVQEAALLDIGAED